MKYLAAATGALFLLGFVRGIPFDALVVIALFVFLAGAAIVGSRSGGRVAALRRAVFLTDTLIGYQETMPESDSNGDNRP